MILHSLQLTPLTLIINELTTNSIKYAFPKNKKNKKIYKSIHIQDVTIYIDNGIGLPEDLVIEEADILGWTIIKALSSQLDGKIFKD